MNLFLLQFIREYTSKVDDLVKDKIEALKEVKAKEKEEKDVIAQQVISLQSSHSIELKSSWCVPSCVVH